MSFYISYCLAQRTGRASNYGETAAQLRNEVFFSQKRGFYDDSFTLELTATIPGSTIRYTTNGTAVANFTMATSERWNDPQSGERRERTEWHRIVLWGKQAEIAGEYLKKGRSCYIEGSLQTREWTDRDGNKRYTTEIVAQNMQMLGRRGDSGGAPGGDSFGGPSGGGGDPLGGPSDDDIPF